MQFLSQQTKRHKLVAKPEYVCSVAWFRFEGEGLGICAGCASLRLSLSWDVHAYYLKENNGYSYLELWRRHVRSGLWARATCNPGDQRRISLGSVCLRTHPTIESEDESHHTASHDRGFIPSQAHL